ncbi:unnamed protein product [Urochloa humidicola]
MRCSGGGSVLRRGPPVPPREATTGSSRSTTGRAVEAAQEVARDSRTRRAPALQPTTGQLERDRGATPLSSDGRSEGPRLCVGSGRHGASAPRCCQIHGGRCATHHRIRGCGRGCWHPDWCARDDGQLERRPAWSLDPLRETQSRQEPQRVSNGAMLLSLYISASSGSARYSLAIEVPTTSRRVAPDCACARLHHVPRA